MLAKSIYIIKGIINRLIMIGSFARLALTKKHEDHDYHYLLEMMEWKLKRMLKGMQKQTLVDTAKQEKQIKYCLYLLSGPLHSSVSTKVQEQYKEKYGEAKVRLVLDENMVYYYKFEKLDNKEDNIRATEEHDAEMYKAVLKEQDMEDRFYKIFSKYSSNWWW